MNAPHMQPDDFHPSQPAAKVHSVPYLLASSAACGAIVFLVSVGAQWLIYEEILHDPGGMRIVSPCIAALVTAVLAFRLQFIMRERRIASLRRYAVISHMNDRIRNALQVICCHTYVNDSTATEDIRDAIRRIDSALREVLPSSV